MTPSFHRHGRLVQRSFVWGLSALGAAALFGVSPPAVGQAAEEPPAATEEAELPHPFFTHMGLPEGVGNYNLRTLGLVTRADGKTEGDFAFHLETGLTPSVGLHIRNDRFLNNDKTEAMFQFATFVSKNGKNGFAPIIEFEFPTHSGVSRVNTLIGFTTSLGGSRWAFNQVLHYDPREDMVDASAALVVKVAQRVFPVVEVLGAAGSGAQTIVTSLVGLKVQLRDWLHLGLAARFPLTNAKEFSWQVAFGPDVEWKL